LEIGIGNTKCFSCREGAIDNDTQSVPCRLVVAEDSRTELMGQ
jgi:hypothetical protein